jgi:hypothetical protein
MNLFFKDYCVFALVSFLMLPWCSVAQANNQCAAEAIVQAGKLLEFHFGKDNRIEIDPTTKRVADIANPKNRKQKFQVYEVWGHIYKGEYRMHLIYYPMDTTCVLMGQEILEFADL